MSAEATNILPFHAEKRSLEQLVAAWIEAKREEDTANSKRIAIEQEICALQPPKQEGATTVEAGGFKLTVTGSLSYKADDIEALRNITSGWDANLVPLRSKTEVDPTGCKWLRANRPELWEQVAKVVTVKPAKPSVKVSV
jgi:hypothetical protein